ncbi:hypothetical protein I4U23_017358 [Adineta vaga]|nr:hypothetical protein I4U23_017358 [Adineta vaga]
MNLDDETKKSFDNIEEILIDISIKIKKIINSPSKEKLFINAIEQELTNYEDIGAAYNSKIIEMLMKQGICISAEQYSLLIYGDTQHDLSMEILLDKLSSSKLFSQSIKQFVDVVKHAGTSSAHLLQLEQVFQSLSEITDSNDECHMTQSKISHLLIYITQLLQIFIDF